MSPDQGALALRLTGSVVGGYRAVEHGLFALAGRWAATASPPAGLFYFEVAQEHAWHAELFEARLPRAAGFDPEALTAAPPAGAALLDALSALDPPGGPGALAGYVRVALPRLVAGYRTHLERLAPVADRPLARALTLVLADERAAAERGEALLQTELTGPSGSAAAQTAAAVESAVLLARAGPGPGLGDLPAVGD